MRDPQAHTAMDEAIEGAEDEIDTAADKIEAVIAEIDKQRGNLTDDAITEAMDAMREIVASLRGAKEGLPTKYYEDAA